jgi:pimeloyl-ACP methyl ester carboxylesterase
VAAITTPVLFIVGEEDIVIPPAVIELSAACIPGARLERVPRAGHSVYFERPAIFNELVERFLG